MSARATGFEIEIGIAVAPERVADFLADLDSLHVLHPLIERIEPKPSRPERPAARRYRVFDTIPVGPLRMRTAYTAELERTGAHEVIGRAWQRPGVELHTVYHAEPASAGGTRLRERCEVRAPALLRRFVLRQAEAAHRATLEGLKRHLEADDASVSPG